MIIKEGLPKFENKKCLIAVLSNHKEETFFAKDEEIKRIDDYYIETPQYTDNEGYFGVYRRGAVYEDKHEFKGQYAHSLAKRLIENVHKIKPSFICLFIAENFKNEVMKILPNEIKKIITMKFFGNYTDRHPFDYLQMIKEKDDKEKDVKLVKPIKPEAQKLIGKNVELDKKTI